MANDPKAAPSYCKWWIDDWSTSSLRKRLRTPALRYAYREFWDLCMSSNDPGRAVDGAGEPWTDSDIAADIGVSLAQFRSMIQVAIAHGKVEKDSELAWKLSKKCVKKSLPDHWKYKRLGPITSDSSQNENSPQTEAEAEAEANKKRVQENNDCPYQEIVDHWNKAVSGVGRLTQVQRVTEKRRVHLRARWQEPMFRDNWARVIEIITQSPFLRGDNGNGWRADFEWCIKNEENYVKVLEGKYARDNTLFGEDAPRRKDQSLELAQRYGK